jgi:hypothetical protein
VGLAAEVRNWQDTRGRRAGQVDAASRKERSMGFLDKLFGPPGRDTFAKLVASAIRRAGETRRILYDKGQFRLVCEGSHSNIQFLQNGYEEYLAVPRNMRPQVVQRWAGHWFASQKDPPAEFEDASHDLLPVLRSRSYYELTRLRLALESGEMADCPYQIMADHLAVGLVYDLPNSMRTISQDDLDAWGVSFEEALTVAKRNLTQLPHSFAEVGGLYTAATNDSYDATRLLLPDLIQQFQLKGSPIATAPNRDRLFVAGEGDLAALRELAKATTEEVQHSRMISGLALRFDGDDWRIWLPDRDHPLYTEFKNLQTRSLGHDYSEQKELLEKLHERDEVDVFVASFSGYQDKGSDLLTSVCVWGEGVLAWLPRTDKIAFAKDNNKETVLVDWDRAAEVVGTQMEPTETYPQRFKVSKFPSSKQLAAMAEK